MTGAPYDPEGTKQERPTTWQLLEKVIIPMALVLLAASQVLVARQQVRVAEVQAEAQRNDASENLQLKYVELFYRDVTDPDPRKKQTSVALLAVMRPDIAQMLARVVYADPQATESLREQTSATLVTANRFGSLVGYRVIVYYDSSTQGDAQQLRANLLALGFPNEITLHKRNASFLADASRYGYHIRYEERYEADAAEYLFKLMPEVLPGSSFRKLRVIGKTSSDGAITVFLFK